MAAPCQSRVFVTTFHSPIHRPGVAKVVGRSILIGMAEKTPKHEEQGGVHVEEKRKTKRPPLYKVLMHNDDFTTMEFVIDVLVRFFNKERTDATRIMLMVHHNGVGLAGVYTREIAETKVTQVLEYAKHNEHPLKVTMEPD